VFDCLTQKTDKLQYSVLIKRVKVRLTRTTNFLITTEEEWRNKMNDAEIMSEIKDANLNYLLLAQQLIRSDKATAIFRLGISKEIADLLEGLSTLQLLKLCSTNMLLARFRFDDSAILSMLTNYTKDRSQAHLHTAVLMAGQNVGEMA
jgi:flagellar transcriptional activator FlhD